MNVNDAQAAVDKAKQDLADAQKHCLFLKENPLIAMAEVLHDWFCCSNHADGCGWFYETWDIPSNTKRRYLEIARRVSAVTDIETIEKIRAAIKGN